MKTLIVALAALAVAAPVALAEGRPEVKVSPTTAKPGSTLTFSLPANEFCPAGETIWLLSGLFHQAVGAKTDPTGEYRGDVGFSTKAAANGRVAAVLEFRFGLDLDFDREAMACSPAGARGGRLP